MMKNSILLPFIKVNNLNLARNINAMRELNNSYGE